MKIGSRLLSLSAAAADGATIPGEWRTRSASTSFLGLCDYHTHCKLHPQRLQSRRQAENVPTKFQAMLAHLKRQCTQADGRLHGAACDRQENQHPQRRSDAGHRAVAARGKVSGQDVPERALNETPQDDLLAVQQAGLLCNRRGAQTSTPRQMSVWLQSVSRRRQGATRKESWCCVARLAGLE